MSIIFSYATTNACNILSCDVLNSNDCRDYVIHPKLSDAKGHQRYQDYIWYARRAPRQHMTLQWCFNQKFKVLYKYVGKHLIPNIPKYVQNLTTAIFTGDKV